MNTQYIIKDQRINRRLYQPDVTIDSLDVNHLFNRFSSEGCEDFYNYLDWVGLVKNPDILILSPSHHYYYDAEDMKGIEAVINLKKLNEIRHIKDFLSNIFEILPIGSYFAGFFRDKNYQGGYTHDEQEIRKKRSRELVAMENGVESEIPFINMMYKIMDLKTNRNMTSMTAKLFLKETGFKVLDMTELNGLTYFCAQKTTALSE